MPDLDDGETAATALAEFLHADILLIDDRDASRIAQQRGLPVTGTLGVLDIAAARGLIDFGAAIRQLERTSFRRPVGLIQALLEKHEGKK